MRSLHITGINPASQPLIYNFDGGTYHQQEMFVNTNFDLLKFKFYILMLKLRMFNFEFELLRIWYLILTGFSLNQKDVYLAAVCFVVIFVDLESIRQHVQSIGLPKRWALQEERSEKRPQYSHRWLGSKLGLLHILADHVLPNAWKDIFY